MSKAIAAARARRNLLAVFTALVLVFLLMPEPAGAVVPRVRQVLVVDADSDPLQFDDGRGTVWVLLYGSATVRIGSTAGGLVDPVAAAIAADRSLLLADANADPLGLGGEYGVLWKVNPAEITADAELIVASALFREPADLLLEPEGTVLLVDMDADPAGYGRPAGAIFRIDLETRSVDVVAASRNFSQPRCLAWGPDGSVLIVDTGANPLSRPDAAGAIFRLNRRTGAVAVERALTRPTFVAPTAVSLLTEGPYAGDLIVVDKDADPDQRGTKPGAVYRLPRDGGNPALFSSHPDFSEPIDILAGLGDDIMVLDQSTEAQQIPPGRGALFRFERDTGNLIQRWDSPVFRSPRGLYQLEGADLDSSSVEWVDESGGYLEPGDIYTARITVRNTGTEDAPAVSLADTMRTPWAWVVGSDSVSVGTTSFDPSTGIFHWSGSLAVGDEAQIRYRVRLNDDAPPGVRVYRRVTLKAGLAPTDFWYYVIPRFESVAGSEFFLDSVTDNGQPVGRLYAIHPDSIRPALVTNALGMKRPTDMVVLDDGRLAILDELHPAGNLGAILAYSTRENGISVLFPLETSDGLVDPIGLGIGRDGRILIVDRDANPNGYPSPNDHPGAVYALDPTTQQLSALFSYEAWREPIDAAMDRKGTLLVLDYEGGTERQGALWELAAGATAPVERYLPSYLFRDPTGMAVDFNDNLYVADPNSPAGSNPTGGALLRVSRAGGGGFAISSADTVLRQPADCAIAPNGTVLVSDREADPRGYGSGGDYGAVFRYTTGAGLSTVSAYHTLRQPDGPVTILQSDMTGSTVELRPENGSFPVPDDTLWIDLTVVNRGLRSERQAAAAISLSPSVLLIGGDAEAGDLSLDPRIGAASWTGRIAFGDTVRMTLTGVISDGASFGEPAGATVKIEGGKFDVNLSRFLNIRAPFAPSDLLLVDRTADPNGLGGTPGAIFRLGDTGDPVELVTSSSGLRQPSALEWSSAGDLIIASERGSDPGIIYRFSTTNGTLIALGPPDTLLKTPSDLLFSREGDLLIVDRDATGPTAFAKGGIFRKEDGVGPLTLFSSDSLFRGPAQLSYGPGGLLYLADPAADPAGLGGETGAIFILDPTSGDVLSYFQSPVLRNPEGLAQVSDSTMLITDPDADVGGQGFNGALFYWATEDGAISTVLAPPTFRGPRRTTILPTGLWLIVDPEIISPEGTPGAVLSFDPDHPTLRFYAWSDSFSFACEAIQKPGPLVTFERYAATDLNGPPLHPADRIAIEGMIRNLGPATAQGVALRDTLPAAASLLNDTVEASSGSVSVPSPGQISWVGDLEPGDSVVIRYEAQLNPALAAGKLLLFRAVVDAPVVGRLTKEIRLQTYVPLEPGFAYLLDQSADPDQNPETRGAVFKIDLATGSVVPMFTSPDLRRAHDIAQIGITDAGFLLLDDLVSTPWGRAALLRYDPVLDEMSLVGGEASWRLPQQVVPLSQEDVLVLDRLADPFNLTTGAGPGAVYRLNLESGQVAVVYSDTTFKNPTGMAILPGTGKIAICDSEADPDDYGLDNGCVFTLDLETQELEVFSTSPLWRTPVAVTGRPGGGLYLVDRDATPYPAGQGHGSLHAISADGVASLVTVSPFFRSLTDVRTDGDGRPVLCDAEADPFGYGVACGAVFRSEPAVTGGFVPLASTPLMQDPTSLAIYRDPTPLGVMTVEATSTDGGILLRWEGSPQEVGARFLVYRREASGSDDPGDAEPIGYELASGAREFSGPGPHEFLDTGVSGGGWYVYLIARVAPGGGVRYSDPLVARAPDAILSLQLMPAAPNPFRPSTTLRFAIPAPGGEVELDIFDVSGRRVRRLIRGPLPMGWHLAVWDARDDRGHPVGSGLYFARIRYRDDVRTGRLVLIR